MQFDARAAKALQPGAYIVVQGCNGLRLVASLSRKTWIYRYKHPATGQMKQVRLGHYPDVPPVDAAARWAELRAVRDAGGDPQAARKLAAVPAGVAAQGAAVYTLGDLVRDYATGYLQVRREAKGARAVQRRLEKATLKHQATPVADVTRRFAFDLITGLADRPVLANSVKTELAAAWVHAMDGGRIPDDLPNWWAQVLARKLRSKGAKRGGEHKGTTKRVLQDAEIGALLACNMHLFSQQVQDFVTLQLWTCTRGAEIVAMRPEFIRGEADGVLWWTMPKALTKNRHIDAAVDLRVPLFGRAEKIVRRLVAAGGPWLFPSVSRAGVLQAQTQAYMQSKVHYRQPYCASRPDHVRERLSVTHWSPHDLRRTGRTLLAAMGCPHEVGEAILGHVVPGVAGDYNLYRYDKERAHWLARLDAHLEGVVTRAADLPA
ncbi:integrase family protein [Acidovorax sp. ACV01]|uniref:tyrosine-type recombinase/integrase n=1 Tax=Acidovorax sp. ACV01 TaxID=2769311 RepID=UPI0017838FAB|nr:integrase family protein [Acidovorax sp. ACV01]MBD9395182.1 integrase family protein [Acidovorax sp. ACV01]